MKLTTCAILAALLFVAQVSSLAIDSKILGRLAVPALFFGGSYATAGAGALIGAVVKKHLIKKTGIVSHPGINIGIGDNGHHVLGGGVKLPLGLLGGGGHEPW